MNLSKLQARLYAVFETDIDTDVPISAIYAAVYPHREPSSVRVMQQGLGSVIARTNNKLQGQRIVPGRLKQTYRLEDVARKK